MGNFACCGRPNPYDFINIDTKEDFAKRYSQILPDLNDKLRSIQYQYYIQPSILIISNIAVLDVLQNENADVNLDEVKAMITDYVEAIKEFPPITQKEKNIRLAEEKIYLASTKITNFLQFYQDYIKKHQVKF